MLNGVNLSRQTPLIFIKSDSQISDLAPCIVRRIREDVEICGYVGIHIIKLAYGWAGMIALANCEAAQTHVISYRIYFVICLYPRIMSMQTISLYYYMTLRHLTHRGPHKFIVIVPQFHKINFQRNPRIAPSVRRRLARQCHWRASGGGFVRGQRVSGGVRRQSQ